MQGRVGACGQDSEHTASTGTIAVGNLHLRVLPAYTVGCRHHTTVLLQFPSTPHSMHRSHHHQPPSSSRTCANMRPSCCAVWWRCSRCIQPDLSPSSCQAGAASVQLQQVPAGPGAAGRQAGRHTRTHTQEVAAENAQHSCQWWLAAAAADQTSPLPSFQNLTPSSCALLVPNMPLLLRHVACRPHAAHACHMCHTLTRRLSAWL